MQDEVLKHTEKIKNTIKDKNTTFFEKFKEIIIEIFIIVFAVTLSIWMHSWSEHNHQQEAVNEFITDLRSDLKNDLLSYQAAEKNLKGTLSMLDSDSIKNKKINNKEIYFQKIFRSSSSGNYEGFKSSGDIRYIENKKLKKMILGYYQSICPLVLNLESDLKNKIDVLNKETCYEPIINSEVLNNIKYKFSFEEYLESIKNNITIYDYAIDLNKKTIAEIDRELKK